MNEVTVTLPDGSSRRVPAGARPRTSRTRSLRGWPQAALAAVVDDRLVDLASRNPRGCPRAHRHLHEPGGAAALPPQHRASDGRRGDAACFPGTQCGIGPAIDEGFFYDFVVERPFVPEDLAAIEQRRCAELAAAGPAVRAADLAREEALSFFAERGEPLKVQLIEEKTAGQSHVSCYTIKDRDTFVDFCVGPHVPSTSKLKPSS
jgi:threonyl-tRNA synthetase